MIYKQILQGNMLLERKQKYFINWKFLHSCTYSQKYNNSLPSKIFIFFLLSDEKISLVYHINFLSCGSFGLKWLWTIFLTILIFQSINNSYAPLHAPGSKAILRSHHRVPNNGGSVPLPCPQTDWQLHQYWLKSQLFIYLLFQNLSSFIYSFIFLI